MPYLCFSEESIIFCLFFAPEVLIYINSELPLVASPVAQSVKNHSAMQETRFQSPGQEDPLEKEMATHSSILA